METPPTGPDDLLTQINENTIRMLRYTRLRFLGTWLAVALLALLTGLALTIALQTSKTNLKQTNDIARVAHETADAAKKQSEDTVSYLKGEQGIPGVPGANGEDGAPGQPSSQPGPVGPAGKPGSAGAAGAAGPTGTPGSTGSTGSTGAVGAVGPAGGAGTPGSDGAAGEVGPAGEQGAAGENGTAGVKGDKGDAGAAGAKGEQGPKGDAGPKGETGPAGPAGPAGATGPPGPAGADATPVDPTVSVGSSANDTTANKVATAACPTGKVATGGGYVIVPSDANLVPIHSGPVGNSQWQVTVQAAPAAGATVWQVLGFAICVTS